MKLSMWIALTICFLTGCAYLDGRRHEKDVIQAPANTASQPANQSQAITNQKNNANINAAKIITPAVH